MHVSLTPELENMVKSRVESGLYGNASEVVREALRKLFLENHHEQKAWNTLKETLTERALDAEHSRPSTRTVQQITEETLNNLPLS